MSLNKMLGELGLVGKGFGTLGTFDFCVAGANVGEKVGLSQMYLQRLGSYKCHFPVLAHFTGDLWSTLKHVYLFDFARSSGCFFARSGGGCFDFWFFGHFTWRHWEFPDLFIVKLQSQTFFTAVV